MAHKFQLSKGQILVICGIEFPVGSDCSLTVTGKNLGEDHDGTPTYSSYLVACEAVKKDVLNSNEFALETSLISFNNQGATVVPTSTDIGGHYISVKGNGADSKLLAFLHNGFGDGNYRLKFVDGYHFR